MNFFMLIIFYCFATSVILTYGIGLERLFIYSNNTKGVFLFVLKNLVFSIVTVSISWFFNKFVLYPLGISFFMPIFLMIILLGLDYLLKLSLPKFKLASEEELIFSYAPVFLAFFHAVSLLEGIAIVVAAQIGMLALSFVLNAIKIKTDEGNASKSWKEAPLVLISMGFLLSGFYFIL